MTMGTKMRYEISIENHFLTTLYNLICTITCCSDKTKYSLGSDRSKDHYKTKYSLGLCFGFAKAASNCAGQCIAVTLCVAVQISPARRFLYYTSGRDIVVKVLMCNDSFDWHY